MNVLYADHCRDFEIEISSADVEYSLDLPNGVKAIEMRCRDGTEFRHSFTKGAVDTSSPPGPYLTVLENGVYLKEHLYLNKHTLYVACDSGSKVVDVRVWL